MELLLIRHALPMRVHNPDGSPADPPLSPTGRAQAERLAAWLDGDAIDALYTSPLRRACETAEPLARTRGLEARVEDGVTEFDAQSEQYVPMEELKASDPERWLALVRNGFYLEGDAATFRSTVIEGLERVIAAHPGERVAVVCHGGVINAWTAHVIGLERVFLFEPHYTSVSRYFAARSGERTLGSLNEVAHLRGCAGA